MVRRIVMNENKKYESAETAIVEITNRSIGLSWAPGGIHMALTGDDIRSLINHPFIMSTFTKDGLSPFMEEMCCDTVRVLRPYRRLFTSVESEYPLEDIEDDEEYNCWLVFVSHGVIYKNEVPSGFYPYASHFLAYMEVLSKVSEAGRQEDELAASYFFDMIKNKYFIED